MCAVVEHGCVVIVREFAVGLVEQPPVACCKTALELWSSVVAAAVEVALCQV